MVINSRWVRVLCLILLGVLILTVAACDNGPSPTDESALMTAVAEETHEEEAMSEPVANCPKVGPRSLFPLGYAAQVFLRIADI